MWVGTSLWRDTDDNGTLDESVSYLQDFRGDVQTLVYPDKGGVAERVRYGPTGYPESFPPADVNFDGVVDEADEDDFAAAIKAFKSDESSYDPRADLDADGDVDEEDETLFLSSLAARNKEEGMWKLSGGPGLLPGDTGAEAGLDNRFGWRGYWYDRRLQDYHVRNRVYDPRPGQFLQVDPLGFDAGDQNLYRYAVGNYSTGYDPLGLDEGHWWDGIGTLIQSWVTPLSRDHERVSAWSDTIIVTRIENDGSHTERLYVPPRENPLEPGGELDRSFNNWQTNQNEAAELARESVTVRVAANELVIRYDELRWGLAVTAIAAHATILVETIVLDMYAGKAAVDALAAGVRTAKLVQEGNKYYLVANNGRRAEVTAEEAMKIREAAEGIKNAARAASQAASACEKADLTVDQITAINRKYGGSTAY